jgi:RHS repeat-associated protein
VTRHPRMGAVEEPEVPVREPSVNQQLSQKTASGVPTSTHTLHQGFGFAISHTSLGISGALYDTRVRCRYTGKERDAESGLDYFGARYYTSTMGRWMSPDWADKPEAVPYSSLDNPQSLNLYGYVLNSPLSHADADGHCCDDQLQFLGGVIQGAASSVSFGLVGAPRSSDSNASLAGQLLGTSIIGGTGTSIVSGSGPPPWVGWPWLLRREEHLLWSQLAQLERLQLGQK